MRRASEAKLITAAITYDDIGQPVHTNTEVSIPVIVSPITRNEWTAAGQMGFSPDVKLSTPSINYDGQNEAVFEGNTYSIYRVYDSGEIAELYLERKAGVNYVAPTPPSE